MEGVHKKCDKIFSFMKLLHAEGKLFIFWRVFLTCEAVFALCFCIPSVYWIFLYANSKEQIKAEQKP
jgi:hypothetical protein